MSKLGRVMDPIADRLALIAVAVTLVIAGVVAVVVPGRRCWFRTPSCWPCRSSTSAATRTCPSAAIGKVRTGLLLAGHAAAGALQAAGPACRSLLRRAWIFLGLGLVGHWIAAYNYFWAILAQGQAASRRQRGTPTTAAPR